MDGLTMKPAFYRMSASTSPPKKNSGPTLLVAELPSHVSVEEETWIILLVVVKP